MGETRKIIKISITMLFCLLLVFSFILTFYFYFAKPSEQPFKNHLSTNMLYEKPYHDMKTSLRWGIFHSISALNNAGFDIMGSNSLQPFYNNYELQIIFIFLFIIGGVGYPVLHDFYYWIVSKIKKEKFHWSLFTKISMITYVLVSLIGLILVFGLELGQTKIGDKTPFWKDEKYGSQSNKVMAILFNTFSTRNAGFSTVDMKSFSSGTLVVYSIMMFIGSAPSSTAGGIRTVTLALVILSIWSKIRGRNSIRVFNKRIPSNTVNRSFIVLVTSLILVIIATIICMSSFKEYGGQLNQENSINAKYSFLDLFFEVSSAFGTTGLSTGLTPKLSLASKLSLILLMFIGQLGVSSTILVWNAKNNKYKKFNFIEEDITIG